LSYAGQVTTTATR